MLRNLERLGIKATFRVVDTAQYQNRIDSFDFDVTISVSTRVISCQMERSIPYNWAIKIAAML